MSTLTKPCAPDAQEKLARMIQVQEETGYIPTLDDVAAVLACATPDAVSAYLTAAMACEPGPRLAMEYQQWQRRCRTEHGQQEETLGVAPDTGVRQDELPPVLKQ